MDGFVVGVLKKWNLSEWIHRFKDQDIDKESLYSLEDQDINDLIPKVGPRVRFKKRLRELKNEDDFLTELFPVTNDREEKRKLDLQGESSEEQPRAKRQCELASTSFSEETILSDVKKIMADVYAKLSGPNTKFTNFLRKKISKLQMETRELVGVFGRTGAGKSSLINAIIEKNKLLPSGDIKACTSVMIKVEGNMRSQKYEAEIEFIEKEEWKDEVWSMLQFLENYKNREKRSDDYDDDDNYEEELTIEVRNCEDKLSALYGEEWTQKTYDKLMDSKYFREVPEFLKPGMKTLTCESFEMLSEEIAKYTTNKGQVGKRRYWPLVKCVTVRVPNNKLLQHVTLMDLPGTGDRNKSRDTMWKKVVGSCSTVWIVAEITRPTAEKECWKILETARSLLGNGGECQRIHFICTKSDHFEDFEDHSAEDRQKRILERNEKVKEDVKNEFSEIRRNKKYFTEDYFEVFTVSSKEFLNGKHPENSEIPDLQNFLQTLNDGHSESLNYVSGARGILSLMEGTRAMVGINEKVCEEVEINKSCQLDLVRKEMEKTYFAFEKCLTEGVEISKGSCEKILKSVLYPPGKQGRSFHRVLKSLVQNYGFNRNKKTGKETNLNAKLSLFLTNSIDEEFRKTFPNDGKRGPFNGVIQKFSLNTENLKQKYKDVELQLIFLKTEEERMKTGLSKMIRDQKKEIYHSLTETIKETMKVCYQEAAQFDGTGILKNQRETIERYVHGAKDTMFEMAKGVMLAKLQSLMEEIMETLENTVDNSIELSLRNPDHLIPNVSRDLNRVESFYDVLKSSSNEDVSNKSCTEPMMQESTIMVTTEPPTLQD